MNDTSPAILYALATPNSQPHPDGHVENGYQINVVDEQINILATIDLGDWERFRPASAGHRLIEHGYMVRPDVPGRSDRGGWKPSPGAPGAYVVPVVARAEVTGR